MYLNYFTECLPNNPEYITDFYISYINYIKLYYYKLCRFAFYISFSFLQGSSLLSSLLLSWATSFITQRLLFRFNWWISLTAEISIKFQHHMYPQLLIIHHTRLSLKYHYIKFKITTTTLPLSALTPCYLLLGYSLYWLKPTWFYISNQTPRKYSLFLHHLNYMPIVNII